MEIWYTYTGALNPELIAGAINWLNDQVYNKQVGKLKFFLSSIGGDTDSAIRLYDYLKASPFEVEMFGFGQIDSAANIIFLAGVRRFAVKGCRFLLHEGTFTIGNPVSALHVHEETLRLLNIIHSRHVEIIAQEIGKKKKEIMAILRQGEIFDTEKAKKFGLVHEIIEKFPLREDQAKTSDS